MILMWLLCLMLLGVALGPNESASLAAIIVLPFAAAFATLCTLLAKDSGWRKWL